MINGIMGYHDKDARAAVTGEVEATTKPKGYQHPDLRTMIVWDMPGAGTMNHPAETYFDDNFLYAFDTLVIVTAERLQEIDINLAKRANELRIPVLFVRNKADQVRHGVRSHQHPVTHLLKAVDAKMRRYTGKSQDQTYIWSLAVGELVNEVRMPSMHKRPWIRHI